MRSRMRGAMVVWAITTTVAVVGIMAGRGGYVPVMDRRTTGDHRGTTRTADSQGEGRIRH